MLKHCFIAGGTCQPAGCFAQLFYDPIVRHKYTVILFSINAMVRASTSFCYHRRRWNMPTSALLRTVVYDPIVEGSLVARNSGDAVAPPPAGAPAPAAAAAAAAAERRAAATAAAASDVASAKAGGTRDDTGADAVSTPKLHAAASGRDAAKTGNGSSSGKAAAGKPRVSELRKAIGAMATFAVSGLIHEMVLLYIQPVASNGKWFTFFAIYVRSPYACSAFCCCRVAGVFCSPIPVSNRDVQSVQCGTRRE